MKKILALLAILAFVAVAATTASADTSRGEITTEVVAFPNDGGTVVGTFVMPADVRGKAPVVLLLHGFTGARDEAPVFQPDFSFDDFLFERTANVFAEHGIATLRIDFRGSGESLDQFGFEGTTFSGQVADADAAINWLQRQRRIGDIGVLGLSQGGLVAAITAEANSRVSSLALWSPVANPVDTYKTILGAETVAEGLTQPSTTSVLPWGAEVTLNRAFYEELYTTDPIVAVSHFDGPMQVIVGLQDTVVAPQPQYGQTYITYHDGQQELVVLDADHVFDAFVGNGAPAVDDAIAESLDWFASTLRHNNGRR